MLFCIIFAAFWVGMIGIGAAAFSSGDPNLLYYGFDSSGYLCGGGGGSTWPVHSHFVINLLCMGPALSPATCALIRLACLTSRYTLQSDSSC